MLVKDLVLSLHTTYRSYHDHKENMAYTSAVLYLSAASSVAFAGSKVWEVGPQARLLSALLISIVVTAFVFVWWQLRNRRWAANMVRACIDLETELVSSPATLDITPSRYDGLTVPKCLVDRLTGIASNRCFLRGPLLSEIATLFVMLIWTVLAALRILSLPLVSCRPTV